MAAASTERALRCPQCLAPLPASRFARSVVCPFCGSTVLLDEHAVSVQRFREALRAWDPPATDGVPGALSIGGSHWIIGRQVGRGEVADVYAARRARWPTELGLLKVLRDRRDVAGFDHEWAILTGLQSGRLPGAPLGSRLASRLPQPVVRGDVTAGEHGGQRAMVLRWASGFFHTCEDVRRVHPGGIEPRAAIWVWRRILEVLAFLHGAGQVHGAVLPQHLLVEHGEHGVRLVGYRRTAGVGTVLAPPCAGDEAFYPQPLLDVGRLTMALDLAMSARCMVALLGGEAATGELPSRVPAPLAAEIGRIAGGTAVAVATSGPPLADAWVLHERLGVLANEVYGPPAFCPITMPEET